jgi:hypothetical protein
MNFKINLKTKLKRSVFLLCFLALNAPQASLAECRYTPMEEIPGFAKTGSSVEYILQLYQFGLWTVGVAAVLMISIGAFMYITSAGNASQTGKAKEYIFDAIAGVILALTSYVLLNTINPALVKIGNDNYGVTTTSGCGGGSSGTSTSGGSGTSGGGSGTCSPVTSGDCSVSSLQSSCFGTNAEKMSKICSVESNGNPAKISTTDVCKDGTKFSIGLFQINMITSAGSVGCNGGDIFTVNKNSTGDPACAKFTGSGGQGTCLECKTNSNGVSYCSKWDCEVKSPTKYTECLAKLTNGQTTITIACALSGNGANTGPWKITASQCGL